jgi:hypothetical protein
MDTSTRPSAHAIEHVPTDIVDFHRIRSSFASTLRGLADTTGDDERSSPSIIRATIQNAEILAWADVAGAESGGAHALLSSPLNRFDVNADLGDGRTGHATFLHVSGRLGVTVSITPHTIERMIMIENPSPWAGHPTFGDRRPGRIAQAIRWLFPFAAHN